MVHDPVHMEELQHHLHTTFSLAIHRLSHFKSLIILYSRSSIIKNKQSLNKFEPANVVTLILKSIDTDCPKIPDYHSVNWYNSNFITSITNNTAAALIINANTTTLHIKCMSHYLT